MLILICNDIVREWTAWHGVARQRKRHGRSSLWWKSFACTMQCEMWGTKSGRSVSFKVQGSRFLHEACGIHVCLCERIYGSSVLLLPLFAFRTVTCEFIDIPVLNKLELKLED
eukprot:RCo045787